MSKNAVFLSNGGHLKKSALAAGYTEGGAAKAGHRMSRDVLVMSNGGNATQAAIRAGYSKKTAQQMGAENLSKPVIKAAVGAEGRQHKATNSAIS